MNTTMDTSDLMPAIASVATRSDACRWTNSVELALAMGWRLASLLARSLATLAGVAGDWQSAGDRSPFRPVSWAAGLQGLY